MGKRAPIRKQAGEGKNGSSGAGSLNRNAHLADAARFNAFGRQPVLDTVLARKMPRADRDEHRSRLVEATLDFPEEEIDFLEKADAFGRLDRLTAQLSALPAGASRDNGAAWGSMVANNILNWRASDNAGAVVNYMSGSQAGDWRPTAPDFGPPDNPQWPGVTPWTLTGGAQFRPAAGPPALTSQA